MIMRKLFITLAILATCIFSAAAADVTVEKNYNLKNFRGLAISSTFDVAVEKSDTYSVVVAVASEYVPYLDVKVTGGILSIGFKNLPRKLSTTEFLKASAVARISMPSIERLSLSGASTFVSEDAFDIKNADFALSVSGASEVKRIEVYGSDADISLSGASRANIAGGFIDVEMSLSGTSRAALTADAEDLSVTVSGTAVADIEGEYDEVDLETSGVANITIKGKASKMEVESSGTSSVDALNMPVGSADVSLSGASVCKAYVLKALEAECTGASTLSYKADDKIRLDLKEIARSATLKKL